MTGLVRNDATEAQNRAADPGGSTWLSANAGSGKTRVLTDRVARLLLQGVDPQHILCLTYTKAAASEMQNRLFKRLGAWAMLGDEALSLALYELGEEETDNLDHARTLFASAVETPGGLKIQTIHSFCSSLLRRFPLEAGVNPQFQEMEERAAELLRDEILDGIANSDQAHVLTRMAQHYTGEDLPRLTGDIVRRQEAFAHDVTHAELCDVFSVSPACSEATIEADLFEPGTAALIGRLTELMAASGKTDQKHAQDLRSVRTFDLSALPVLRRVFLTQNDTSRAHTPNKAVAEALPEVAEFKERIADAVDQLKAVQAVDRSLALHAFARVFLGRYQEAKQATGSLDFDDLIQKTRMLLSNPKVSDWVLFRLDGGISHILVDEAQDTSPAQWDVIEKLTQELTSGLGAREDTNRTLFVVGDKKQSIYSFQGADPNEFDRMEQSYAHRLAAIDTFLNRSTLDFSFRSSDAILRLVNETFVDQDAAGFATGQSHRAFHADLPGRVDLWPRLPKQTSKLEADWTDPVDLLPETHHTVQLAQQVACEIEAMLSPDSPARLPVVEDGSYALRRVVAGDIMVLVQRRSALFHEIIRACKKRSLPISGADRLRVGAELAVRDLLALLSFLSTPEDSLSLAVVLRSPLFGWSEKALFDLAAERIEPHLWQTLRNRRAAHPDTYSALEDLRGQIDFLRPYELLERILTRFDGRKKLIGRLGTEAEDGIDALLSQALSYERNAIPSLTGFLRWAQVDDLEIKRQIDSSGNLIRVMTVHGAKGLESPVVILPDCAHRAITVKDDVLPVNDTAIWNMPSNKAPRALDTIHSDEKSAIEAERLRLLYVAMTRAEHWLIVAAAGDAPKQGTDWYGLVEAGMARVGARDHDFAQGRGLRYEFGTWDLPFAPDAGQAAPADPEKPAALLASIGAVPMRATPLSPSDLGGAKALASETGLAEDVALARGTYIHTLLEILAGHPASDWQNLIATVPTPPMLSAERVTAAQAEAIRTLETPDLSWIFAPDALAEVSLTASVGEQNLLGTIDRLILGHDNVIAVDFKTNMAAPATAENCPEGLLRQMGAYALALSQIYPDREIKTGLLWTATQEYMSLPQNLVTEALYRSPHLDDARPPS